ncbi:Trehalose transport system permease protein SugA [bacterium HR28]|uniref:Sugar ABC transporter permease n=1 Tax=Thermomicrobium roseum TaxID=500 RepID=A0A7C1JR55_THERO|nr:Trehalose transport system permease protein SugA [bacterium HR28]
MRGIPPVTTPQRRGDAVAAPVRRIPWSRETLVSWADRQAGAVLVLPAVLVILVLSIFPLLFSLYLSLSRFQPVSGGFRIHYVGLLNYRKLLLGSEREHFLGRLGELGLGGWLAFVVLAAIGLVLLWRSLRASPLSISRIAGHTVVAVAGLLALWLAVRTIVTSGGRPGTLVVTWVYVFGGVALQFLVGLLLASLCAQQLPGRRFFRVVFLLPMMITPVGVAYTFRMLTDTGKGPFAPIANWLGYANVSWVNDPWGARIAVMIGDLWQWTPFMFIVLLAALESQSPEPIEAAIVDGANRWQIFWHITLPQIGPVASTVILIRLIEAFKIFDMPNVLTGGGPGTATESLTLHAYVLWRSLDYGTSAAVAYSLLFVVTFVGIAYVRLVHRRLTEAL